MSAIKRSILVSGASSGIGRAISQRLLLEGHQVIGLCRDLSRFSSHPGFTGIRLDLSRLEDIQPIASKLQKDFPALDAVVFAAGYGQFGGLEQFSFSQITELMTVNFTAQVFLTKTLLPGLKHKPHVNLVYIGSDAALKGSRNGTV